MSESDFNISLKGNADAVYASLARRKEFYITVQNLTENYMPQVRVKLSMPPEVRLIVKSEWYGGIAKHYSKNRLFTILVKENGVYDITATLTTKKGHNITFPFIVQAGTTQVAPTGTISLLSKPIVDKPVSNVNCPYCHAEIKEDAKFCPHCGSNVEEKLKEIQETKLATHCSNCGTELQEEAKFCASCGQKV
jgi:RNA polymerase subunit RPABC4/transcription elongation factor Spt4